MNLLSLLLLTVPLPSGTISSTAAEYDGKGLALNGEVQLDHSLGRMTAEEASLQREEEGNKNFPFSLIELHKEVVLNLLEYGELRCEHARLDFSALKGELTAKEDGLVSYIEPLRKKGKQADPFSLKAKVLDLTFKKQDKDNYTIETILAKEGVLISYASCLLHAHRALYRQMDGGKALNGLVTAYPQDENTLCQIEHAGDFVEAKSIDLDLHKGSLSLHHPRGTLASTLIPHIQKNNLNFTGNLLIWDQIHNTLTLQGNAHVKEASLGTLFATNELKIVQDKQTLQQISTQGKTTLHYKYGADIHKLTCHGTFLLDREKMQATLSSPEVDGVILSKEQIYYEEPRIGTYANQATIEYAACESSFRPVALTLKGNVRLFSRDPRQPKRYALADRIHYSPASRTFILAADAQNRVLLWDEGQALQISAQEIHIAVDNATHKENIQGIGNVRFTLTSEENSLLQRLFPQYKISPP